MVTGFVIQTIATATGRLQPNQIAPPAASTIWNGTGTKAISKPTATARVIDVRFSNHRFGLCSNVPNTLRNVRSSRTAFGLGR